MPWSVERIEAYLVEYNLGLKVLPGGKFQLNPPPDMPKPVFDRLAATLRPHCVSRRQELIDHFQRYRTPPEKKRARVQVRADQWARVLALFDAVGGRIAGYSSHTRLTEWADPLSRTCPQHWTAARVCPQFADVENPFTWVSLPGSRKTERVIPVSKAGNVARMTRAGKLPKSARNAPLRHCRDNDNPPAKSHRPRRFHTTDPNQLPD